jgi:hypothetical protein
MMRFLSEVEPRGLPHDQQIERFGHPLPNRLGAPQLRFQRANLSIVFLLPNRLGAPQLRFQGANLSIAFRDLLSEGFNASHRARFKRVS